MIGLNSGFACAHGFRMLLSDGLRALGVGQAVVVVTCLGGF